MEFNIICFEKKIVCEGNCTNTIIETVVNGDTLDLYVTATEDRLNFIELEWSF